MALILTHFLDDTLLPEVLKDLQGRGYKLYNLNTDDVVDLKSFFAASIRQLPMGEAQLDPTEEWRFPANWDGFSDFLWQGIFDQIGMVAILWPNSSDLKTRNPALYDDAVGAILGVFEISGGLASSYSLYLGGTGDGYSLTLPKR